LATPHHGGRVILPPQPNSKVFVAELPAVWHKATRIRSHEPFGRCVCYFATSRMVPALQARSGIHPDLKYRAGRDGGTCTHKPLRMAAPTKEPRAAPRHTFCQRLHPLSLAATGFISRGSKGNYASLLRTYDTVVRVRHYRSDANRLSLAGFVAPAAWQGFHLPRSPVHRLEAGISGFEGALCEKLAFPAPPH